MNAPRKTVQYKHPTPHRTTRPPPQVHQLQDVVAQFLPIVIGRCFAQMPRFAVHMNPD